MTEAGGVGTVAGRSTARSHVGRVRTINEDRVVEFPESGVWVVADGMGGHRGGDLAAQQVVTAVRDLLASDPHPAPDAIVAALQAANAAIFARNAARGEQAGSTVVVLSRHGWSAQVAWAGDSRCYRLRGDGSELLTRDHSVVQQLIDAGLLTPDAASRHPQANVVTRALGVQDRCEIDTLTIALEAGDRFLLCSDGLSKTMRDTDVVTGAIEPLADRLLAAALDRDGTDNISLILVAP